MQEISPRSTVVGPVVALALAAGAVVSFAAGDAVGFRSESAERVFVLTWLLGWALLAWAVIIAGGASVVLLRRMLARLRVSGLGATLLVASFALVALAASTHPLWGSGSGSGG